MRGTTLAMSTLSLHLALPAVAADQALYDCLATTGAGDRALQEAAWGGDEPAVAELLATTDPSPSGCLDGAFPLASVETLREALIALEIGVLHEERTRHSQARHGELQALSLESTTAVVTPLTLELLPDDWDQVGSYRDDIRSAVYEIRDGSITLRLSGWSSPPLWLATHRGHAQVVATLLDAGAPLDQAPPGAPPPLHLACVEGHLAVARVLLDAGADPHTPDDTGATPLLLAVRHDNPRTIALLLERGADLEARTPTGGTPLFAAAEAGASASIEVLLAAHADVRHRDSAGETALHKAARHGHREPAIILLTRGSPRWRRSADGHTARQLARAHPHTYEAFAWLDRLRWQLYGGVGLSRIHTGGHSLTPGVAVGGRLSLGLAPRLRLFADVGFNLDGSFIEEPSLGEPVFVENTGQYYEFIRVDLAPMLRVALGPPLDNHPYAFVGPEIRQVVSAQLRSGDPEIDPLDVRDHLATTGPAWKVGLGYVGQHMGWFPFLEVSYDQGIGDTMDGWSGALGSATLVIGVGH